MILSLTILTIGSLGCATTTDSGGSSTKSADRTPDGLIRVDTDRPGDLYLRDDHGIGGYDAVIVAPATIFYLRTSDRLDPDLEDAYLAALEQSVMDAADDAGVEMVNTPGPCALTIGVGFVNVELARSDSAEILGEMVFVIQYQDSMSGEALLRFAAPEKIEHASGGISREDQISQSFDRMIQEVDIINALRVATKKPSPPRPGCRGDLLNAGRSVDAAPPAP
jgi:hypothetical protein